MPGGPQKYNPTKPLKKESGPGRRKEGKSQRGGQGQLAIKWRYRGGGMYPGKITRLHPCTLHTNQKSPEENESKGERKEFFLLKLWLSTLGGRTAWTSQVTLATPSVTILLCRARFYYDGPYARNAREDAAEFALKKLIALFSQPSVCNCNPYCWN
ncbi:unnamed protein product [Tuber aestivum]|uniref:DRBM domain-containing protein n=1 Tax=Tuber aestivum TaxID=59557 RepID=A0A292Q113_9PEZI|nr:unnamed protein product [Tuber aestivum]